MIYMTSTLITSNTFNTTLGAGISVSGPYVDMGANTAVRLWVYSDQNIQIQLVYADNSAGDSSVSELYSVYGSHNTAVNSTKKKAWQKTIVTNPVGGQPAERVVVKTRHAIRDPNPVLTYQTDDITLQGNINLEEFEVSIGQLVTDVSTSSMQLWGSTTSSTLDNYRIILTDDDGRLYVTSQQGTYVNVVSSVDNPVYVTSSAAESSVLMYGNDGTNNRVALTDSTGRFQVTTSAEQSTVQLYATSNGTNRLAVLADSDGRIYTVNVPDASTVIYGNDGTTNQVALTDSAGRFQVTTSAEHSTVQLYGNTVGLTRIPVLVDASGRIEVVSTASAPSYITSSAADSTVVVYGTDGTTNKAALTDSAGRFQVTTSAEHSTVQLYATSTGDDRLALLADSAGRIFTVNVPDSSTVIYGNDGTNNRVALTDGAGRFQVTTSAEHSTVQLYGITTGLEKVPVLVDANGRIPVFSTTDDPVYITASAAESSVVIYGNDGTNTQVALTDSAGRFQVTTSAEHSTVQLYATSTGDDRLAVLADSNGRIYTVNVPDSSMVIYGNDGASNRAVLTDSVGRFQVTTSAEHSTVQLYGSTVESVKLPVLVDANGRIITSNQADASVVIYGNDGTNNQVALTDTAGRFQVTTSAEHSTVQLYATNTGTDRLPVLVDPNGRVYITASAAVSSIMMVGSGANDSLNNVSVNANGYLTNKLAADTSVVLMGSTYSGTVLPIVVDICGRIITTELIPSNIIHTGTINIGQSTLYHDSLGGTLTTFMGQSNADMSLTIIISPDGTFDVSTADQFHISNGVPFYHDHETGARYLKLESNATGDLTAYANSK